MDCAELSVRCCSTPNTPAPSETMSNYPRSMPCWLPHHEPPHMRTSTRRYQPGCSPLSSTASRHAQTRERRHTSSPNDPGPIAEHLHDEPGCCTGLAPNLLRGNPR